MISALSSGNVSKYEFLTCKDVLPEKDFLEKAAAIKRFEYSPFGKEFQKQTSVAEKQCQKFDSPFESNENKENKTNNKKSCTKSHQVYIKYFTFFKYHDSSKFIKLSLDSKMVF